ncbi:uncharacterized protein RCC_10573 [Ramularia collo-cygni]|uniref:Uncharacterized protein n=1 Tax=Ramularia collo-cygni TaxID=112498 RepID=A0A2D3VFZ0_9PEZI|nr:uncharacterized protein RCC_10573 [Ramularia collo-cygni]CZT24845.1 uncharacterized protein RCC_10573 [Ramularia collo-cygni]
MSKTTTPNVWILTPFWLAILGAIILILLSSASGFLIWIDYHSQYYDYSYFYYADYAMPIAYLAWAVVLVLLCALTFILNIVSIVFVAKKRAKAASFLLWTNLTLFVIWAVILICAFLVPPFGIDLFLLIGDCILIAMSLGQMIYGAVLFHRIRKGNALPVTKTTEVTATPVQHWVSSPVVK